MTDSPSALLERAAAELQRRTTWNFSTSVPASCSRCHPAPRCLCIEQPVPSDYWLATLPRDVAQPLAEWLRMAAKEYRDRERLPKLGEPNPHGVPVDLTGAFGPTYWTTALTFARTILGEPS